MNTQEFLSVLKNNPNKALLFEYAPTQLVGANYHITEIKNVDIHSVDCGGNPNKWQETVVQLWESPNEKAKTTYLTVDKALQIFERVNSINPLQNSTEIKFEYGNKSFHTAQLNVFDVAIENDQLIVKMHSEKTQCKAPSTCGVPEKQPQTTTACCTPSSGCC